LVRKLEGVRICGRTMCRRENNIRMDIRKIGWEGVEWMLLTQDRGQLQALVNTIMNLWIP
jgi:hypothetical protein